MLEPGSLQLYSSLFRKLVTCRRNDNDGLEKIEPIRILLNSTLNIEIVYVILEGIVKASKMNFEHNDQIS